MAVRDPRLDSILRRARALSTQPISLAQKQRRMRRIVREAFWLTAERLGEDEAVELFLEIANQEGSTEPPTSEN